jgi:hypothetical protein
MQETRPYKAHPCALRDRLLFASGRGACYSQGETGPFLAAGVPAGRARRPAGQ